MGKATRSAQRTEKRDLWRNLKRIVPAVLAVLLVALGLYAGYQLAGEHVHRNRVLVTIGVAPGEVFPYLVDPARTTRWVDGLTASEWLTNGGPRLGARLRDIITIDGKRYLLESELTAYEAGRRVAVSNSNEGFSSTAAYSLRPTAGGSELELVLETVYHYWLGRLFGQLITFTAQRRLVADMERLKAFVEADANLER
jgi:uncharacterized protein YndB with AHSA1/START domain